MSDRLYDMGQISRAAEIERLRARLAAADALLRETNLNYYLNPTLHAKIRAFLAADSADVCTRCGAIGWHQCTADQPPGIAKT